MNRKPDSTILSEEQCQRIERGLAEDVEPRKVAAYLCLHMGLALMEVTALRFCDIDMDEGVINVQNGVGAAGVLSALDEPRRLPMPPQTADYLRRHGSLYRSGDCFILTGDTVVPAFYPMQNVLTSVATKHHVGATLSASDLRTAFIRRCLQAGADLYSLCAYVGVKQPNVIARRYAAYLQPRLERIAALELFDEPHVQECIPGGRASKRMNLLILGAGGQGHVAKETAEAIGIFDKIAFLDDNTAIDGVLDTIGHLGRYVGEYPVAFVAIGGNALRRTLIKRLEGAGYIVPVLRHPTATISPTVQAGAGTIFEAKTIVNASVKVGKGVILASACVVDHGTVIGDYAHVDVGAMVKKDSVVPALEKVMSGSIFDSAAAKAGNRWRDKGEAI